ncbi:MAG: hypothetical protein U1E78_00135 [Gammaproteobacteria bacterium]
MNRLDNGKITLSCENSPVKGISGLNVEPCFSNASYFGLAEDLREPRNLVEKAAVRSPPTDYLNPYLFGESSPPKFKQY